MLESHHLADDFLTASDLFMDRDNANFFVELDFFLRFLLFVFILFAVTSFLFFSVCLFDLLVVTGLLPVDLLEQ